MNSKELKNYIIDNEKCEVILEELGCHNIKLHSNKYLSCSFPDGDNIGAINIYLDNQIGRA